MLLSLAPSQFHVFLNSESQFMFKETKYNYADTWQGYIIKVLRAVQFVGKTLKVKCCCNCMYQAWCWLKWWHDVRYYSFVQDVFLFNKIFLRLPVDFIDFRLIRYLQEVIAYDENVILMVSSNLSYLRRQNRTNNNYILKAEQKLVR